MLQRWKPFCLELCPLKDRHAIYEQTLFLSARILRERFHPKSRITHDCCWLSNERNKIEIGFAMPALKAVATAIWTARNAKIEGLFNLEKQIWKDLNRSIFVLKEI